MKRNGFSLIETLIYIMLLAIFCMVAFAWIGKSIQSIVKINHASKNVMMTQAIFARLASDIQMADSARARWDFKEEQLSLYHSNRSITWAKQKDKLYRTENRSKSLIGIGIIQFSIRPITHDAHITSITCALEFSDISFAHIMRVYNG